MARPVLPDARGPGGGEAEGRPEGGVGIEPVCEDREGVVRGGVDKVIFCAIIYIQGLQDTRLRYAVTTGGIYDYKKEKSYFRERDNRKGREPR